MTKNRKATREEQLRAKREKRRYPFTSATKLIELVDKRHYGDVVELINRFEPYLEDGGRGPFMLTRLTFDLVRLSMKRQFVIDELALLLLKLKQEGGLMCSQAVFIRYFASPDHCNLEISEKSLKVLVLEAMRRNY